MLTAKRTWPRVRKSIRSRAASTATETWASSVEAPRWGVTTTWRMADQRVIRGRRLGIEDVDGGARDLAALRGLPASAASSIRPPRAQLMIRTVGFIMAISRAPTRLRVSAVSGVCSVMKVAAGPQVVKPRNALDAALQSLFGGEERIEADDRHSKTAGALGDGQSNPAQSDDSQSLAFELCAGELASFPLAGFEAIVGLGNISRQRKDQGHRVLGRGDRVPSGRIHHDDPEPRGGRDVDVVDAYARPHDRLQPRLAFENSGRELRARADHDSVGSLKRLAKAGGINGELGVDHHLDAGLGTQSGKPLFRQLVGNQHAMRRHQSTPIRFQFSGHSSCGKMKSMIRGRSSADRDGALLADQHLLGRGNAPARLDVKAELRERHLQGCQSADHVDLVGVTHVADPDDFSLELILPADRRDSEPLGQFAADLPVLQAFGNAEGGQALGRPGS